MTLTEEDFYHEKIDLCRRINRSAANQYVSRGIEPVQAAIGAIYSAFDVAEALHGGDRFAAHEWMQTAIDIMERQLLAEARNAN